VFVESVAAMMTMNEVVDGWKRQHVGSKQIGTAERDRVDIDKQARLTWNRCALETAASGGLGV